MSRSSSLTHGPGRLTRHLRHLVAAAVPAALLATGLVAMAPAAEANNGPVRIINANGGGPGEGLRFYFGGGQIQITRDSQNQVYYPLQTPNGTGAEDLYNGIFLRVGDTIVGTKAAYWVNDKEVKAPITRWVNWDSVTTAGGSTDGPGTITATLTYRAPSGRAYTVDYTATLADIEDDFVTETLKVNVPAGNTDEVKLYRSIDTYLGGSDNGPGYAKFPGGDTSKTPTEVGVVSRDGRVVEAYRDSSPDWDGWFSGMFICPVSIICTGKDSIFAGGNLERGTAGIDGNPNTDNGISVMWDTPDAAGSTTYDYDIIFTKGPGIVAPEIRPAQQRVAGVAGLPLPQTRSFSEFRFTGNVTYSVAPALPAGLSINPQTGVISGTPDQRMAETTFTVTGRGPWPQAASAEVTIFVDKARSRISPNGQRMAGKVGREFGPTMPLTAYNFDGTMTYSISPDLPRGLSINTRTGVISGTPRETVVDTEYTITATDGTETRYPFIEITIDPKDPEPLALAPLEQEIGGQVGRRIDPTIPFEAFNFDGPVEYSVTPALPEGLSLDPETGVITGTPREAVWSDRFFVIARHKTQMLYGAVTITVDPRDPEPLSIAPAVQVVPGIAGKPIDPTTPYEAFGFSGDPTFSLYPDVPPGLEIDPNTGIITGTPTEEFWAYYLIIADYGDERATARIDFEIDARGGSIAPEEQFVSGVVGRKFRPSSPIEVYGFDSAPTFSVSPRLPAGLTIDRRTGIISGTPAEDLSFGRFTIRATDGEITREAFVDIVVDDGSVDACISPELQKAAGVVGKAIKRTAEYAVYGTGKGTRFTISPALPKGLGIDPVTGIVSGKPAQALKTTVFTVTAKGAKNSITATIELTVEPGTDSKAVIAPSDELATGATGEPMEITTPFTTYGMGKTPKFTVSPALPAGLELDSRTGVISGTPTRAVKGSTFTVTAKGNGRKATAEVTLAVGSASDPIRQRPIAALGLPETLASGEWTKVIGLPVLTNADQEAKVTVQCLLTRGAMRAAAPAGDVRGCRVERRDGALWAWTVTTPVQVSLTAPAVTGYLAYDKQVLIKPGG